MRTTRDLAEFVCGASYKDIDPVVIERAKDLSLSSLGSAILGAQMQVPRTLAQYVKAQNAPEECGVIGFGFRTSAEWAAVMNCSSSHCTELEDVAWPEAQYTCFLIPAVFSLGEKLNASGKAVLEALVLGFEVAARPGTVCADGGANVRGWLPCSQLGAAGAAAAACKLLQMPFEQTWDALALAASFGVGLNRQTGSGAHVIEAGFSGSNGIMAALLARAGIGGNRTIMEGRAGFWDALAGQPEIEFELGHGKDFRVMAVGMKKFPCCYLAQRLIDTLMALVRDHNITGDNVETLTVDVNGIFPQILKYPDPADGEQARFSLPHLAAAALCGEPMDWRTFTTEKVRDPKLVALRPKVNMVSHAEWGSRMLGGHDLLRLQLKDGRTFERVCTTAHGDADDPLTREEVIAKFNTCVEGLTSVSTQRAAVAQLAALEDVPDVSGLMRMLTSLH